jgi:hypothetical protein
MRKLRIPPTQENRGQPEVTRAALIPPFADPESALPLPVHKLERFQRKRNLVVAP